jgi:microcin C transport system permease protein
MRAIGFFFTLLGALAMVGEVKGIAFPTARWFFSVSREVPWLHADTVPWFAWVASALLVLVGLVILGRSFTGGPGDPVIQRRMKRFREIKRGYYSLIILGFLAFLALLDQSLVGKRALAVKYEGRWLFPAFDAKEFKNKDFGLDGESAEAPANYRDLKRHFAASGKGKVILPLVPYDPTGDTLAPRSRPLELRDGIYYEGRGEKPYFGLAARYYDIEDSKIHLRYTMRKGKFNGPVDGWDKAGAQTYSAEYKDAAVVSEKYNGEGEKDEFLTIESSEPRAVKYHPAPPTPDTGNFLGTTSQGYDMLAYLYGGLQVNFKAALLFLPVVYLVGITVGMLMGYFGKWADIAMHRVIEIFENMPFLFIVIILSSMVPDQFKGLGIILAILMIFGWMGIATLMRTTIYRERERDYISAARVIGAGTPRILFRHLLPNTISIIVTLIPFTFSGLISSLTALDYLGFGLPPEYATWGKLLNDGLSNLSAPWLVSATFVALVSMLVLITFVGEAIREAFDPKKYTYYR